MGDWSWGVRWLASARMDRRCWGELLDPVACVEHIELWVSVDAIVEGLGKAGVEIDKATDFSGGRLPIELSSSPAMECPEGAGCRG